MMEIEVVWQTFLLSKSFEVLTVNKMKQYENLPFHDLMNKLWSWFTTKNIWK